jgi:hypothetical protein
MVVPDKMTGGTRGTRCWESLFQRTKKSDNVPCFQQLPYGRATVALQVNGAYDLINNRVQNFGLAGLGVFLWGLQDDMRSWYRLSRRIKAPITHCHARSSKIDERPRVQAEVTAVQFLGLGNRVLRPIRETYSWCGGRLTPTSYFLTTVSGLSCNGSSFPL